jgi:hypothetical protein
MIVVRHSLPERLRLGVTTLRTDLWLTKAVRTGFGDVEGALQVRNNPSCGSFLVCRVRHGAGRAVGTTGSAHQFGCPAGSKPAQRGDFSSGDSLLDVPDDMLRTGVNTE